MRFKSYASCPYWRVYEFRDPSCV